MRLFRGDCACGLAAYGVRCSFDCQGPVCCGAHGNGGQALVLVLVRVRVQVLVPVLVFGCFAGAGLF